MGKFQLPSVRRNSAAVEESDLSRSELQDVLLDPDITEVDRLLLGGWCDLLGPIEGGFIWPGEAGGLEDEDVVVRTHVLTTRSV